MSRIRGKDTAIELLVRRELHSRGFRFRLHNKKLPGKPDLVLPKHRTAVLVNGCFWHAHGCNLSSVPNSNQLFWIEKLEGTIERDQRVFFELLKAGWRVATVWECELRGKLPEEVSALGDRLAEFILEPEAESIELGPPRKPLSGLSA